MNGRAIPEKFEADVMRLAADGQSVREIATWLGTHGIKASKSAVAGLLKARRAERSEVTRGIVREKLGREVVADVEHLEELRLEVRKKKATLTKKQVRDWTELTKLEVSIVDKKLHYAGADETEAGNAGLANLFAQLERVDGK